MAQRDPFSWASEYANTQHQRAAQESNDAQQSLLSVFQSEAGRQRPWSDLPVDLARQNNSFQNSVGLAAIRAGNKPAMAPDKIGRLITGSAQAAGLDPDMMLTIAGIESTFDPNARNKSGAAGLWQFMPTTAQGLGLANPFDEEESTRAAMIHARQNASVLERAGIPVNAGTMYLAWQQGASGAAKLLSNPNAPAESIVGRAAVLQNGGRPGMSAGQFANLWMSKANRAYEARVKTRQEYASRYRQNGSIDQAAADTKAKVANIYGATPEDEEDNG